MSLDSMRDLLLEQLRDVYSAEKQLVKALPRMAKASTSIELRDAFTAHLEETRGQVDRLDEVFQVLGKNPKNRTCLGMEGLIEEAEEMCETKGEDAVLDAGLIAQAQRIEHYEMAAYGCLVAFAKAVNETIVVGLLELSLREEEAADEALSLIAERAVNPAAAAVGDVDDSEASKQERKEKKDGKGKKEKVGKGVKERSHEDEMLDSSLDSTPAGKSGRDDDDE